MIPHSRPCFNESDAQAVADVVRGGQVAGGKLVTQFEAELAAMSQRRYAVATSSGTAALSLALRTLGVGPDDEVVIPSYVCTSLYHAVCSVQARPVLADCATHSFSVSASTIKPHLKPATKAVIVPHLFGHAAPIDEIVALGVPVIEDCAMALGATWRGQPVGNAGTVAVFSFYATKLLATGEGGMVVTDDALVAACIRDLRSYDMCDDLKPRFNFKLTDLQAALGLSQLRRYAGFVKRRQAIAVRYQEAFAGLNVELPSVPPESTSCWYRYVLRCYEPLDPVIEKFRTGGVVCDRPVYRPLHTYCELPKADFPEAAASQASALSVPCYPALNEHEVDRIINLACEIFPSR